MTSKCNQCKKFTAVAEGIKCNKCNSFYHRTCVNISSDIGATKKWLCVACKPVPVSAQIAAGVREAGGERAEEPPADADARFPHSLAREIKLLRASVTREMGSMRLELSRLNTIVADFGTRVDGVEERLDGPEKAARVEDVDDVAEIVARLRIELNEREQDSFANDVEIVGLEERAGEELVAAVLLVAEQFGVPLEERDVVSAERRGARRAAAGPARPVAVRLARRALRDALVRAARARRGVERAGAAGGRLYVNERLTAANRHLLYRAREAARRAGWRYVWARGGRVFARFGERSSVRRVRSLLDLPELFGDPV